MTEQNEIPERLKNMTLRELTEKYGKFTWPQYAVDHVFKKYFKQKTYLKILITTNIITAVICIILIAR